MTDEQWRELLSYTIALLVKIHATQLSETPITEETARLLQEIYKSNYEPEGLVQKLITEVRDYTLFVARKDPNMDMPKHLRGLYS